MYSNTTPSRSQSPPVGSPLYHASEPRQYARDASLVLIGIRGTGKSSLAVMASRALGFRLLEADQQFFRMSNLSRAAYTSKHGVKEYQRQEMEVMRTTLSEHPKGAVITCGPGFVEGKGKDILQEFGKEHPVIYLMRDADEIKSYFRIGDVNYLARIIALSASFLRAASNFEFYNLSESSFQGYDANMIQHLRSPTSLILKNVEREFLQLISSIYFGGKYDDERAVIHATSLLPPESKPFTYALSLPLSQWIDTSSKFRGFDLGVDVVEIIVDLPAVADGEKTFDHAMATEIARHYYCIRRYFQLPIVFHVELGTIVSAEPTSLPPKAALESIYFEILNFALRLAPEYLTVELSCEERNIQQLISMRGKTKLIGHSNLSSLGLTSWENPDCKAQVARAADLGCSIVRLYKNGTSMADNLSVQQFRHQFKKENNERVTLIAYNVGPLGHMSCYLNTTLTPVTHPLLGDDPPGSARNWLLTVQDCQRALYASSTLDKMYFGLYGADAGNSRAQPMHAAALEFYGMPHEYRLFSSNSLNYLQELVADPYFGGASVTAPFKMEVIPLLDHLSPSARAIGAVNTVIPLRSNDSQALLERNRGGRAVALYGENTDWIGIHTTVLRNLSPINAVNSGTTGLIIGAGGMARAAIYAMMQLGIRSIFVYNRTAENARALFNQFVDVKLQGTEDAIAGSATTRTGEVHNIRYIPSLKEPWPAEAKPPTIIVSCIPANSVGGQPPASINLYQDWFSSPTGGVLVELGYRPIETPLLKQTRALNNDRWIIIDGLQVLPEQGIAQFELFTGRKAPQNLMRASIPRD